MREHFQTARHHAVYLVRHGEIESNRIGRYAGRSDEALTQEGIEQTRELAKVLCDERLDGIRSSSVARAYETALQLSDLLGLGVEVDGRLDEMRLGPWEGMLETDVARDFPEGHRLWLTRPDQLRLEGRETLEDVQRRITAAVEDASRVGRLLLVTHVAPIRVAILSTEGRSLQHYKRIDVPNGACFRIDLEGRSVHRVEQVESSRRHRRSGSEAISA